MLSIVYSGAQDLRKYSLSSGGGSGESASMYLAYAVGEIGKLEVQSGNVYLSEGFIGPDLYAVMKVDGYEILTGVQLFPNPVDKELQVRVPKPGNYEIQIYNLNGVLVMSKESEILNRYGIRVSRLLTGTYVLRIINREDKKYAVLKFVKR